MQQQRSMSLASRKRSTLPGESRIVPASRCASSSATSASASGFIMRHGWMCRWTSKTLTGEEYEAFCLPENQKANSESRNGSARADRPSHSSFCIRILIFSFSMADDRHPLRQHHQAHARGRGRAGVLKLARAQDLRVHFVAVDGLEAALAEVVLRRRRQQIELAQAARRQTVEELPHDAPPQAAVAILRIDGDRADQRRELIGLGAAARDELA